MAFSFISTSFCFVSFSHVLITLLIKIQQDLPILYNWLDWYLGHSPKRRIRPTPLSFTLINVDPNSKQFRTMNLHEPQFCLVLDIGLAKHWLRMPPGRNLARQVKQPYQFARLRVVSLLLEHLDRRLAHSCGQFVSDSCEFARWGQHAEMGDTLHAI